MKYRMILIGKLEEGIAERVRETLQRGALQRGGAGEVGEIAWLGEGEACEIPCSESVALSAELRGFLAARRVDWACLEAAGRRKRCLVADMDSTMIEGESLDILAARLGHGEAVAAITDRAMRGQLDFAEALRERVRLLAGRDASILEEVAESLTLREGARLLVQTMRAHNCPALLVSGGFGCFVEVVAARLGFEGFRANRLEIVGGRITGRVASPIGGRLEKRFYAESFARERGFGLGDILAVGDGANDVEMVRGAGLGVSFRGRDILDDVADVCLRYGGLASALYLQGYCKEDFTEG